MVVAATAVEAWAPAAAIVVVMRLVVVVVEAMVVVVVVVATLLVAGFTMAVLITPYRPSATLRLALLA
jgi:hypothetical protein